MCNIKKQTTSFYCSGVVAKEKLVWWNNLVSGSLSYSGSGIGDSSNTTTVDSSTGTGMPKTAFSSQIYHTTPILTEVQ